RRASSPTASTTTTGSSTTRRRSSPGTSTTRSPRRVGSAGSVPSSTAARGSGWCTRAAALSGTAGRAGRGTAPPPQHPPRSGMGPVIHHGSDAMKEKYLPPTATGKLHVSFGVTEDDAGTDTSRIRTFAKREGNGWIVNGKKVWNTKAQQAQKILLLARTTPREECARRLDGMTLFLADLDPAHVEIREIPKLGR